jgi:hypothetical protein
MRKGEPPDASGLTLKCQESLGSNGPLHASQVIGAAARVEAATRMLRPQGQVAGIRLVLRRLVVPVVIVSFCRQIVMASRSAASWGDCPRFG